MRMSYHGRYRGKRGREGSRDRRSRSWREYGKEIAEAIDLLRGVGETKAENGVRACVDNSVEIKSVLDGEREWRRGARAR